MLRLVRLLLVLSVLWCGVHVGEPALAHDETLHHQWGAEAGHSPDDGEEGAALDVAQIGHHHCPMAPDDCHAAPAAGILPDAILPFAGSVAELASLSQAPPLQPPAA